MALSLKRKSVYIIGDPGADGRGLFKGHFATVLSTHGTDRLFVAIEETVSYGPPLCVALPRACLVFLDDDARGDEVPKAVLKARPKHGG